MENPETTLKIATAGEALIDLIGRPDGLFDPCLGGSVFNFTRAMARQQIGTLYLNPLSGDRFGRRLAQALAADGVQLARPEPVPQPTSLAVVALSEAGHPDYAFYRQGVADRAVSAEGLMRSCDAAPTLEMVCSGCLALAPEDAQIYLPWLAACRQAGKTVVVDANLRPSVMPDMAAYRRHVLAALQLADVIKASDEDLGHLGIAGSTPLEQAKNLLAGTNAHLMALTLGGEGACLLTRGGQVWRAREAAPVKVVDTVGAGDCFLAGLLTAVLLEKDLVLAQLADAPARRIVSHALASATLCVMQRGCVPPSRDEVLARMRDFPCQLTAETSV
ncbi:PfkB family carbohydrate kinase [Polaromonas naphthalenivorans]|uniref:PfkB domain protein n=1 Tax=Polaromonas naphthalenivorans (strain CJ2) TaxID=365044 RepID=A1VQH5_POLNA|nr:PfkB family carbohydrate kinase [Polaromonas naphthalenivorans]ABM37903.1 PfkB domain protein [Polaromonas naphthalenivorans CJ2]